MSSSFITSGSTPASQSSYTFIGINIGAPHETRRVIVIVHSQYGLSRTLNSATIAGVAATIHMKTTQNENIAIISRQVPTGTTADIVVNFSGTVNNCGLGVYRLINETSGVPFATVSDTSKSSGILSASINVPDNGDLFVGMTTYSNSVAGVTWTGATKDYQMAEESHSEFSGASLTKLPAETARVVSSASYNDGGTGGSLIAMTWPSFDPVGGRSRGAIIA